MFSVVCPIHRTPYCYYQVSISFVFTFTITISITICLFLIILFVCLLQKLHTIYKNTLSNFLLHLPFPWNIWNQVTIFWGSCSNLLSPHCHQLVDNLQLLFSCAPLWNCSCPWMYRCYIVMAPSQVSMPGINICHAPILTRWQISKSFPSWHSWTHTPPSFL